MLLDAENVLILVLMTNPPAIIILDHIFIFLIFLVVALVLLRINGAFFYDPAHSTMRCRILSFDIFRDCETILLPFDHYGDEFFDQECERLIEVLEDTTR